MIEETFTADPSTGDPLRVVRELTFPVPPPPEPVRILVQTTRPVCVEIELE